MEMARLVSTWSKDPSSRVGAVAVEDNGRVLATGWNGFPRGVEDTEERLSDRATKLLYTVHAEMNCVYNAGYVGSSLRGSTLFVYGLPVCSECAKGVIQSGVRLVVMCHDNLRPEWAMSHARSLEMFAEAGVEIMRIDLS